MAPDPNTYRCSYRVAYEADSDAPLSRDILAQIRFGTGAVRSSDPRQVHVALPQFDTVPVAEVWRSRVPVQHAWADGFGYAHNGEVLFGQLHLEEHEIADLDRATTRAYVRIDLLLRRLGYPCWLRIWNFLAHINRGEGDAERYRQFTKGRCHALALKPDFEIRLPAATAIGTHGSGMTVYFLAAREPGEQVENPRQVSAFRYPAEYGPRSPSFSRATLKHWPDGIHLFVSGTASVVGHESRHPDDALAQLEETRRNFDALLQHAASLKPSAGPFRAASLKMFVRPDWHQPVLLSHARHLFGEDVPLLFLAGDICRRDLAIEIEGLFTASPRSASPEDEA
ncbi:MAG: chorismate transformation enzyme, FkbO/Hyg5 family [Panacagrimonas sp.]